MFRPRNLATKKNPWNKGKLLGQKHPLSLKQIWSIRHRLSRECLLRVTSSQSSVYHPSGGFRPTAAVQIGPKWAASAAPC